MVRMYDINLYDTKTAINGTINKNDNHNTTITTNNNNSNINLHATTYDDEYDNIVAVDGIVRGIDAAYIYHPNHVVPRRANQYKSSNNSNSNSKKRNTIPRMVLTCVATCTSSSSSSNKNINVSHLPVTRKSQQQQMRRRRCRCITSVLLCITAVIVLVLSVYHTQIKDINPTETTTTTTSSSSNMNHGKQLPKILQYDHEDDTEYYEPETKIIVHHTTSTGGNTSDGEGATITSSCSNFITVPTSTASAATAAALSNNTNTSWTTYGQELVQHISSKYGVANTINVEDQIYSKHYGYGTNVLMALNGTMMIIAYEGVTGYDKAFGIHIDIVRYNTTQSKWFVEQTISDVTRNHGHTTQSVNYQSMSISYNGQRIIFSDGYGVHVFIYDPQHILRPINMKLALKNIPQIWKKLITIQDPYYNSTISTTTNTSYQQQQQYQFGLDVVTNCDGTIIAISGVTPQYSYTQIYQQEDTDSSDDEWKLIGEIQNIRFGGNIAMDITGTRLVIGTIASEGWRGMVQIFDYHPQNVDADKKWVRIGQPIVGKAPLEMWGGKVTISSSSSKDSNSSIVAIASKNGDTNRIQTYQLSTYTNTTTGIETKLWKPIGQELIGTNNPYEHYGYDIAMNYDGTILAVGAPGDKALYYNMIHNNKTLSPIDKEFIRGRIYVYQLRNNYTEWVRIDNNKLHSRMDGDLFGNCVAMNEYGTIIVGGAPRRVGKLYEHILGSVQPYIVRADNAI